VATSSNTLRQTIARVSRQIKQASANSDKMLHLATQNQELFAQIERAWAELHGQPAAPAAAGARQAQPAAT
jgi:hypothetical protein